MQDKVAVEKPDVIAQVLEQVKSQPKAERGFERCMYTLWGRDDQRIWEQVPEADLTDTVVEGTGRQDWRKLRPFDLLPDLDPNTGGVAHQMLYVGDNLRIACERIWGPQPNFERAGDHPTIFFQFSGVGLVETSYGPYELHPGEALLIPAMVAHRTIGSPNCRRMVYYPKDHLNANLVPEEAVTDVRYSTHRAGDPETVENLPVAVRPTDGRIREHMTHWDDRPGEAFLFERTYDAMVGQAETGPRPVKIRPFDYFTTAPDSPKLMVRSATLWESPTFIQRVYANAGRQPAPHRGYDEDEFWFQFAGLVEQETDHGKYSMGCGETSMAEAGIVHTSTMRPGCLRLTAYTNKPIRMVVDPSQHLRQSQFEVRESVIRGWPEG